MFERWLQREKIPALHENDVERLIIQLGLYDKIESGELSCSQCGKRININNIQCIYRDSDELKFCCDNLDCYKALLNKRKTLDK